LGAEIPQPNLRWPASVTPDQTRRTGASRDHRVRFAGTALQVGRTAQDGSAATSRPQENADGHDPGQHGPGQAGPHAHTDLGRCTGHLPAGKRAR